MNTGNHTHDGDSTESFDITAPSDLGTYDVKFKAYKDENCSGEAPSGWYPLRDGLTVERASQGVQNPPLPDTCGLDIALVIDNSNSINGTELALMKDAFTSFVEIAFSGTPTQFSVTRFGTSANVVQSFTHNSADVITAINSVSTGGGGTDWEEGISTARSTFDPRVIIPDLMVFSSDGNPTFPNCGGSSSCQADVDAAVVEANAVKNDKIRMHMLGIGNNLNVNNLKAISGPNVDTDDILTSDVVTTDFSTLRSACGICRSDVWRNYHGKQIYRFR